MSYSAVDRDRICRVGYGAADATGACNVAYDGSGSITSQPTRDGSRKLTYAPDGSTQTITSQNAAGQLAGTASFYYDPFGQLGLSYTTEPGVAGAQTAVFLGSFEQRTNPGQPTTTIRNIPGPGGLIASRRGADGPWVFGFSEQRGGRFFTDATGAFIQDLDYQPYGETASTGATRGSKLFTNAQWNHGEALTPLGLSRLGARLYDPALGRFLSRDPLVRTANPYSFADNDPLNLSDPTGLDPNVPGLAIYQRYYPNDPGKASIAVATAVFVGHTLKSIISGWGDGESDYGGGIPAAAKAVGRAFVDYKWGYINGVATHLKNTAVGALKNAGRMAVSPGYAYVMASYEAMESAKDAIEAVANDPVAVLKSFVPQNAYELGQFNGRMDALVTETILTANVFRAASGFGTFSEDIVNTAKGGSIRNVNVGPGAARSMNCANCAIATDATLGGSPASALPGTATTMFELSAALGKSVDRWLLTTGPQGVRTVVTAWGPGSRGIVFGTAPAGRSVGHFFNVINQGGVIRFLDGQIGGAAQVEGYSDYFLIRTN